MNENILCGPFVANCCLPAINTEVVNKDYYKTTNLPEKNIIMYAGTY